MTEYGIGKCGGASAFASADGAKSETSTRWYVVQTQVNGETKAALNLIRQGYEIYLPRYLRRRRHARKADFVARPLFPRYLFVAVDVATQRWRSIQSTFGVSHLVTDGSGPAVVPEGIVAALKAREDAKGLVKMDAGPKFASGDKVRVLTGVFMDSAGVFDGVVDRDRVAILLEMLGGKVRVHLDADLVAAAGAQRSAWPRKSPRRVLLPIGCRRVKSVSPGVR
jgi:transcriptional antiterminator RfaH